MFHTRAMAFLPVGLLALLATGCLLSVEPETATNPVGTEHTVTATLLNPEVISEEFCENFVAELTENYDAEDFTDEELIIVQGLLSVCEGQGGGGAALPAEHNLVNFEVVSGPNAGLNSDANGVCQPSCNSPDANDQVSWTYQSNGVAGTDIIEVCVGSITEAVGTITQTDVSASQVFPPGFETLEDLLRDVLNETFGTNHESFEDFFCQTVEKVWVAPTPTPTPEPKEEILRQRPPNIGAGLSGLFQGQPTPLPTAAAPAPAVTTPIRPPSTGDAGLR